MQVSVQEKESTLKQIGTGITLVGIGSLFLLAVSATIALDVLILIAIATDKDNNRRENRRDNGRQQFLTGYLLGSMQNRNYNNSRNQNVHLDFGDMSLYQAAGVMSLATAPAIGITAGMSKYYFHRPDVCNGFLITWGVASGLVVVGLVMHAAGHQVEKRSQNGVSSAPATLYLATVKNQFVSPNLSGDTQSSNAFSV